MNEGDKVPVTTITTTATGDDEEKGVLTQHQAGVLQRWLGKRLLRCGGSFASETLNL